MDPRLRALVTKSLYERNRNVDPSAVLDVGAGDFGEHSLLDDLANTPQGMMDVAGRGDAPPMIQTPFDIGMYGAQWVDDLVNGRDVGAPVSSIIGKNRGLKDVGLMAGQMTPGGSTYDAVFGSGDGWDPLTENLREGNYAAAAGQGMGIASDIAALGAPALAIFLGLASDDANQLIKAFKSKPGMSMDEAYNLISEKTGKPMNAVQGKSGKWYQFFEDPPATAMKYMTPQDQRLGAVMAQHGDDGRLLKDVMPRTDDVYERFPALGETKVQYENAPPNQGGYTSKDGGPPRIVINANTEFPPEFGVPKELTGPMTLTHEGTHRGIQLSGGEEGSNPAWFDQGNFFQYDPDLTAKASKAAGLKPGEAYDPYGLYDLNEGEAIARLNANLWIDQQLNPGLVTRNPLEQLDVPPNQVHFTGDQEPLVGPYKKFWEGDKAPRTSAMVSPVRPPAGMMPASEDPIFELIRQQNKKDPFAGTGSAMAFDKTPLGDYLNFERELTTGDTGANARLNSTRAHVEEAKQGKHRPPPMETMSMEEINALAQELALKRNRSYSAFPPKAERPDPNWLPPDISHLTDEQRAAVLAQGKGPARLPEWMVDEDFVRRMQEPEHIGWPNRNNDPAMSFQSPRPDDPGLSYGWTGKETGRDTYGPQLDELGDYPSYALERPDPAEVLSRPSLGGAPRPKTGEPPPGASMSIWRENGTPNVDAINTHMKSLAGTSKVLDLGEVTDRGVPARTITEPTALRKTSVGGDRYVGAPPGVNTPEAEEALIRKVMDYAKRGTHGADFYTEFQDQIRNNTRDPVKAKRFAGGSGITSQDTDPKSNTNFAFKAMNQYEMGEPIRSGRYPNNVQGKLVTAFNEGRILSEDPKSGQYAYNMLPKEFRPTDAEHTALSGYDQAWRPVNDQHMFALFGYPEGSQGGANMTRHQYMDRIQFEAIRRLNAEAQANAPGIGGEAPRIGEYWNPETGQAAAWETQRGASGETAKGYFDASKARTQMAAIPGRTTGVSDDLLRAPLKTKEQYTNEMQQALDDGSGGNAIMRRLGFSGPVRRGYGPWQGEMEPNMVIDLALGNSGSGMNRTVDPASDKMMRTGRRWNQVGLGQEASGASQPYQAGNITVAGSDLASVDNFALATKDDYDRAYQMAGKVFGPGWENKVVIMPSQDNTLLIKNISGSPGKDFMAQVGQFGEAGKGRDVLGQFDNARWDISPEEAARRSTPDDTVTSYRSLLDETANDPHLNDIFVKDIIPVYKRIQDVSDVWGTKTGQGADTVADRLRRIIIEGGSNWRGAIDAAVKKGIIPVVAGVIAAEALQDGGWSGSQSVN